MVPCGVRRRVFLLSLHAALVASFALAALPSILGSEIVEGQRFVLFKQQGNQPAAQQTCVAAGGNLACPKTLAQLNAAARLGYKYKSAGTYNYVWLGGQGNTAMSEWRWQDTNNTLFHSNGLCLQAACWPFTKSTNPETCMMFYVNLGSVSAPGPWKAYPCQLSAATLCSVPLSATATPTASQSATRLVTQTRSRVGTFSTTRSETPTPTRRLQHATTITLLHTRLATPTSVAPRRPAHGSTPSLSTVAWSASASSARDRQRPGASHTTTGSTAPSEAEQALPPAAGQPEAPTLYTAARASVVASAVVLPLTAGRGPTMAALRRAATCTDPSLEESPSRLEYPVHFAAAGGDPLSRHAGGAVIGVACFAFFAILLTAYVAAQLSLLGVLVTVAFYAPSIAFGFGATMSMGSAARAVFGVCFACVSAAAVMGAWASVTASSEPTVARRLAKARNFAGAFLSEDANNASAIFPTAAKCTVAIELAVNLIANASCGVLTVTCRTEFGVIALGSYVLFALYLAVNRPVASRVSLGFLFANTIGSAVMVCFAVVFAAGSVHDEDAHNDRVDLVSTALLFLFLLQPVVEVALAVYENRRVRGSPIGFQNQHAAAAHVPPAAALDSGRLLSMYPKQSTYAQTGKQISTPLLLVPPSFTNNTNPLLPN